MTSPASHQPGEREPGRCPSRDPHAAHWHVMRTGSVTFASFQCPGAAAAADQPGAGGEADDEAAHDAAGWQQAVDWHAGYRAGLAAQPAPSAGQDTAPWRVGQHYRIHVYEADLPVATFHRPEDAVRAVAAVNGAAGQPTERLRDEIARGYAEWTATPYKPEQWQIDNGYDFADALLDGPLARLIAERDEDEDLVMRWQGIAWQAIRERDEARAQVRRVSKTSGELEREAEQGAHPARREAARRIRRALDDPEHNPGT